MTRARRSSLGPLESYRTKQELVLARLRDAIYDEEFAPGERLGLRDLAVSLGTSTMPVREALQALASEGLVTLVPHRGARVTPLSAEEFQELYMARLGLEGLAARLGAANMTDTSLARMRQLLGSMERALADGDVDAYLRGDFEFHTTHYEASGRQRLVQRIQSLKRQAQRYMRRARLLLAASEATRTFHCDLLEACVDRNGPLAEQLVRRDLESTVEELRDQLFGREDGRPDLAQL